ncbi:type IV secretory system conjugative DNA transfer family protein [Nocardia sp. XZ_19_369]|uniref:type IV secretory system conjugative DNA transfer family protein n=1 Tax=Nocardia sp. XZ_19_369 TaxID=2769487 RepID=UPI001890B170|nr:type IV secretory system conjugative DNA transfer family protein [Nocardia sp. XZ_19_369]
MTARTNRPTPVRAELFAAGGLIVCALMGTMILAAYRLGGGRDPSWNPAVLAELAAGHRHWPATATAIIVVELILLTAAACSAAHLLARRGKSHGTTRRPIDAAAKTMTDPATLDLFDEKWSLAETRRLAPGIPADHPAARGVLMGRTIRGDRPAHLPWEWVTVAIAGTRMGKTAALAIPAVITAPGPCVATSNKPDLYTHTWLPRKEVGSLWLFDLQGVTTGERGEASFWWNPLAPVADLPAAKKAASYFVGAEKEDGAKVDAYFDGSAQDLLAAYMFAAALAGGDLIHAVEWMANEQSAVPAAVLRARGEHAVARMLTSKQNVTERQRDGFYDMARRFLESLDAQRYAKAILPNRRITIGVAADGTITTGPGDWVHSLPEFDPAAFAVSTDTLYALSREGPDSAAALTTALVGQVLDQAEAAGARTGTGRLDIPMIAVLDEAANVCKLQSLPDQYSHFGSRGIIPITILQSPSQGRNVWGQTRFQVMLDAASCVWYGGNIDDKEFLTSLSELIDDHWVRNDQTSSPTGLLATGQSSRSTSWQPERILKLSALAALTSDRAILRLPGSKPLLLRKTYWQDGEFADIIRRSARTKPSHTTTGGPALLDKQGPRP